MTAFLKLRRLLPAKPIRAATIAWVDRLSDEKWEMCAAHSRHNCLCTSHRKEIRMKGEQLMTSACLSTCVKTAIPVGHP